MRPAAMAQTAVTAPDRSQSPRCPCKAPPKFYHPMVRLHRRGTAPDLFVALAVDWFKMPPGESRRWRAPQLTNGLTPAISGAGEESLRSPPRPFLSPPGSGRAYRTTAAPAP